MRHGFRLDGRTGRLSRFFSDANPGSPRRVLCGCLLALGLLVPWSVWSLQGGVPDASSSGPPRGFGDHSGLAESNSNPAVQEQLGERRNSERQKQLVADTEKLFLLAQELKEEVAKSNKDQLSVGVVKKSEEIEKLAKSVKEKMRGY